MIAAVTDLSNYIKGIIESASELFKFRNYTNNRTDRKIDNLFESDECDNINKTIKCRDLLYFTCLQSKDNKSYQTANRIITEEGMM